MKNELGNIFIASFIEVLHSIWYAVVELLRYIVIFVRIATYFVMMYLGYKLYTQRGYFALGGEIFIPLIVYFITEIFIRYANRKGKGAKIPVPKKRFTIKQDDGEINVLIDRQEELILYMSNLEDWLERNMYM